LPEVGEEGQRRLKSARVLIVGAGGLGSPALLYLAAAGAGTIGVVDFDAVDLSNLQRQIIYVNEDVGRSKVETAVKRAGELNKDITLVPHQTRLSADNIAEIISAYDLVVDGTDNFATRYLVNDACVLLGKPNVYGSIYRFEGQSSVFAYDGGPCYRCLYPDPPPPEAVPNCAEGGVLGVMAGIIGCIQATEAIKVILKKEGTLAGRLLLYDALEMRFDVLKIKKNPDCPICGDRPTITTIAESAVCCAQPDSTPGKGAEINARDLATQLKEGKSIVLLDVRNPEEYSLCHLDNSVLIPLPELPDRVGELDPSADIVVYCKGGFRGRKAAELLAENGFTRVRNLTGGIVAWANDVDRSMPTY
jgi:adenylyltransferase/sulfurtransferase